TQGRRAKTLNLAHSNLRDHPLHVPQDRCAHPRAQDPHQDSAALKLSACSSLDRARHLNRRPRSMNDAASAALALTFTLQRVANVREHAPPAARLLSCAHIANRQLPRIIRASCRRNSLRWVLEGLTHRGPHLGRPRMDRRQFSYPVKLLTFAVSV